MTATESFFLNLGVSYLSLLVLVAILLFIFHRKYKDYREEHSALFAGLFSFAGSFALFIFLFKTVSDVCLIFLSHLFHHKFTIIDDFTMHLTHTEKQSEPIFLFHTNPQHRKLITILGSSSGRLR